MKTIATLFALLVASTAFAAEPTTATATSAPAKVEKKAEVKPRKSIVAKDHKKSVTATTTAPITAPAAVK